MRRNKGFTLIELMIVVAIIAIIAAIAVPSLLGAKKSANEASAISSLRTVSTCCEQYCTTNGAYPADLTTLNTAGMIDSALAGGSKSGYNFGSAVDSSDALFLIGGGTFTLYASPQTINVTGDRHFMVDNSGAIQQSNDGGATWTALQ